MDHIDTNWTGYQISNWSSARE
uniref:Uncharacterized protein n=1 Tax=Arundo donax TaxID=35708 RepID=A0A0A9BDL2_ARUDO